MAKKTTKKASAVKKPPTKTEIFRTICENTGLMRKDVAAVFEELETMIGKNLKKSGPGQFTVPGLCKIVTQRKPAVKTHTRPDPFNPGQMMQVKAKPARTIVKVRPLKGLKDMV